jgi:transposase-like protein
MSCSKTRGKKGKPHTNPDDPPRRRANKQRGHGTFATDRPPVLGAVGRETGVAQLWVAARVDSATVRDFIERTTRRDVLLYSDEWSGYAWVASSGRGHATVCHTAREWARDDDGDGLREVHNNTLEGLWTGLRNFLRPFRGVSKWFLDEYVGIFQWIHTIKGVTSDFIRALFGLRLTTDLGP